ncbi:GNAT family N-acetyltransferase [Leeuwenhoekiella sp. NPDC079379]|uniref:GNAT family N-acetyltransferase n=1 Tax=Leeuwenhoekiella sp. NPDC079379 TaxID=3364122 RepID=UPI0037C75BE5
MTEETQFEIALLNAEDAKALNLLLKEDNDAFKEYFPITLSENKSLSATKEYISTKEKEAENKLGFTFAIHTKIHPEIAGLVILKEIDLEKKVAEFAYCLSPRFQGRGWVLQAVSQIIDFAFVNHQISTFKIITHKSNEKSIAVATHNGFVWDSTLEEEFKTEDKEAQDMELYILKK